MNSKDGKEKVSVLFIKTLLLIPLGTIFQGYIPFLNKVVFFVSLIFLACYLFTAKLRGYQWMLAVIGFAIWLISLLSTSKEDLLININMAIYYIFCIVFFAFFMTEKYAIWKIMSDNKKFIFRVVLIYSLILLISIPLPISYAASEAGGWGDALYFVSFSGSPNRVGQSSLYICALITVLMVMKAYKKKLLFLCTLPNIYVFFMGGSRTYFILGLCIVVINLYVSVKNKKNFKYIFVIVGIMLSYFMLSSAMMDKLAATYKPDAKNDIDFWVRITNARILIWAENIVRFSETDMFGHWFGNGINFTSHIGIWAHNDFIEIVCSYGYFGLVLYLITMFMVMRTFKVFSRENKMILSFLCIFMWIFNAFFNFFYVYFNAMLSYAFMLMAISHYVNCKNIKYQLEVKS